jgi:tetratricopeptide (TPR) repeat protein
MSLSADFLADTGDDAGRLEALRQFGRALPHAGFYERHPDVILSVLRSHIHPHASGCWSWTGEPYATVEGKRMRFDPRLLAWVAGTAAIRGQAPTLWPTCDFKECVRPEHQLEVVPLRTALAELRAACGEGNEQIVMAALNRGQPGRVESPHYPRAVATTRAKWDAWLRRADLEDDLLSLMPEVPLIWQPETYRRRLRAVRMEDQEQIERVLYLAQVLGVHGASREAAARSLVAFWKRVRVLTGPAEGGCWRWLSQAGGGTPLYTDGQDDPHSQIDPCQFAWVIGTGVLPSTPPVRFMSCPSSADCINPGHRTQVVPVSEAALLFPAGLDDAALCRAAAAYERAIREQWLQAFIWNGRWAVKLTDLLFWTRAGANGEAIALAGQGPQAEASRGPDERLHGLAYRAMHYAETGRVEGAARAIKDLLALARQLGQPIWEARALFDAGCLLAQMPQPALSIGYFELALQKCNELDRVRLAVSTRISLGRLLAQADRIEDALAVLEDARQVVESDIGDARFTSEELAFLRIGTYRALGAAHSQEGQLAQALAWFERAWQINSAWIGPAELEALREEIAVSLSGNSDPQAALGIGREFLARRDPVKDLPLLFAVSHQLGLLCLRIADYAGAIRHFQEASRCFKRVYPCSNRTLEGRLLTDTGRAFNGKGQVAQAIAYWRLGERRLQEAGAEEQAIPRGLIEATRQMCQEQGQPLLFDALWQASGDVYSWLCVMSIARPATADERLRLFGTPPER